MICCSHCNTQQPILSRQSMATISLPNPSISPDIDLSAANYANFLAWQAQSRHRRASSQTHFNRFQAQCHQRTYCQLRYKELSERGAEYTKNIVERRLSQACDCEACGRPMSRSGSDASTSVDSRRSDSSSEHDLRSVRSLEDHRTSASKASGRNSLVIQPPPRSRHHRRRAGVGS